MLPFVDLPFEGVKVVSFHSVHDEEGGSDVPGKKEHAIHKMSGPETSGLDLDFFFFVDFGPGEDLFGSGFGAPVREFAFDNGLAFEVFVGEVLLGGVDERIVETPEDFLY